MRDIWVISDTHLGHENILKFADKDGKKFRGDLFKDVDHMNEAILNNWNSVVKPGDKVYHLGDVFFGDKEKFKTLWPRFNGSKRLIVGNHDDISWLSSGSFFKKVYMWRMWPEYNIIFSHVPLHESTLAPRIQKEKYKEGDCGSEPVKVLNVHGHIHQNQSPDGPYYNVSCEAVNYTPVHIEDLAKIAKRYSE